MGLGARFMLAIALLVSAAVGFFAPAHRWLDHSEAVAHDDSRPHHHDRDEEGDDHRDSGQPHDEHGCTICLIAVTMYWSGRAGEELSNLELARIMNERGDVVPLPWGYRALPFGRGPPTAA
jgi:hypothetical protein